MVALLEFENGSNFISHITMDVITHVEKKGELRINR